MVLANKARRRNPPPHQFFNHMVYILGISPMSRSHRICKQCRPRSNSTRESFSRYYAATNNDPPITARTRARTAKFTRGAIPNNHSLLRSAGAASSFSHPRAPSSWRVRSLLQRGRPPWTFKALAGSIAPTAVGLSVSRMFGSSGSAMYVRSMQCTYIHTCTRLAFSLCNRTSSGAKLVSCLTHHCRPCDLMRLDLHSPRGFRSRVQTF